MDDHHKHRYPVLPRKGGLRLCACGHALAYHPALPAWYGADHSNGPRCTFCDCTDPRVGEYQGFRMRMSHEG